MSFAADPTTAIARASLVRALIQSLSSANQAHFEHRRTRLDTRCGFAIEFTCVNTLAAAAGAPRLRGLRPAVVMQLASTGGVEPQDLEALFHNDVSRSLQ